jgi:uncharacterized protein
MNRRRLAFAAVLVIAGACKTATPDELFSQPSGGPSQSGNAGSSAGSGGSRNDPEPSGGASTGGGKPPLGFAGAAGEMSGGGDEPGPPQPLDECGEPPVREGSFSRKRLREAAADCAIWHYCRAEGGLRALEDAVGAYQDLPSDAGLESAQGAFREAMARWSAAELFQFGPAGSRVESAGKDPVHGQGLRDFIYAWPVVARCRVEEQVILRGYESSWTPVQISARGLFGIELLLFYPSRDTACTANSVTGKAFASLSPDDIDVAKRDYAAALSSDVLSRLQTLQQAWDPGGDDFRQTFIDARGYESEQQALDVLAWSLLYIERETKDYKVGIPAGMTLTHPVTVAEGSFSLTASESIRQNLRGFRALFQGCGANGEGLGFDDWLRDVGQAELASDMLSALDGAQAAADAFPPAHQATPAEFKALYDALRALTSLLKADFFGTGSTLNLKLPAGIASDTD